MYFGWCTRNHNRRSVKPLPFILQPDYADRIAVIVQNNGSGPLILMGALAVRANNDRRTHLIDILPAPSNGLFFSNFNRIEQRRALRPGDQVVLLDISFPIESPSALVYRDVLREALGEMTLELTYTDIYDTGFPKYSVKLDWFNR